MTTATAYAVHVYQDGTHIGRLTPEGSTTRRVMFAGMFPREIAEKIAAEINARENLADEAGTGLSAKARPFSQ